MYVKQSSQLAWAIGLVLGAHAGFGLAPAMAQEAAAPAAALEEVVVTARKRTESLTDVSAALAVVSGDDLARKQLTDVSGLQLIVPTVTVGETVGAMKVTMRGLGNASNTRGEDSHGGVPRRRRRRVTTRRRRALSLFDVSSASRCCEARRARCTAATRPAGAINVVTGQAHRRPSTAI